MFSESDAFLNVIFDNPDDDTPRLGYADWLEEHGQANYARFIRLQCEAARKTMWGREANQLWEEIGDVWHELMEEWWLWPSNLCNIDAIHFHRGLPCKEVIFDIEQFVRLGSRWWPWFPTPCCEFEIAGDRMADAAAIPTLQRVRWMRLRRGDEISFQMLPPFLASPHLRNLEVLDLTGVWLYPADLPTVIPDGILSGLREIRLVLFDVDSTEMASSSGPPAPEPSTIDAARKMLEARFDHVIIEVIEG